jgi:hypothetical protein
MARKAFASTLVKMAPGSQIAQWSEQLLECRLWSVMSNSSTRAITPTD